MHLYIKAFLLACLHNSGSRLRCSRLLCVSVVRVEIITACVEMIQYDFNIRVHVCVANLLQI